MPARRFRLAELVGELGGEAIGDPDVEIDRVGSLKSAGPSTIAFFLQDRHRSDLEQTRAGAVIVGEAARDATPLPRIVCRDPYLYFARVSALLNPFPGAVPGIHPTAVVEPGASVSPAAAVGAHCFVGSRAVIEEGVVLAPGCVVGVGATVGRGSRLHANVTVHADCVVGARAIIHSGAVIGADGFGFAPDRGTWFKIPQIGRVVIGDDVEIGANTTIDRGALDDTVIEQGVKLDNQIQIAHNCRIGAHTAIAACVGIAGSTTIGRHCMIGGAAMIGGHLTIADQVIVSGGTAVMKSIPEKGTYTGVYPSAKHGDWARSAALLRNLDRLAERIRDLERRLDQTESKP